MGELEGFFKALPSLALFSFLIVVVAFLVDTFYPLIIAGGVTGIAYAGYRAYLIHPSTIERGLRQSAFELYESVRQPDVPTAEEFEQLTLDALKRTGDPPSFDICRVVFGLCEYLYRLEGFGDTLRPPPAGATPLELARYKDAISKHVVKMAKPGVVRDAADTLGRAIRAFCDELPTFALVTPDELLAQAEKIDAGDKLSDFSVGLLETVNVKEAVQALILPFYTDDSETAPYQKLRESFDRNYANQKEVLPAASKLPPAELVSAYLHGTPFVHLFEAVVPFSIPDQLRYEGTMVVAPSGRGKTTLLSTFLEKDLDKVRDGKASVIILDPKNDFGRHASQLARFGKGGDLEGKLTIIEPSPQLALNPLDLGSNEEHTLDFIEHIFSSLLEHPMTPQQSTLFRSIFLVLKHKPDATFSDFNAFLAEGWKPFEQYLAKLDPEEQQFFLRDFDDRIYRDNRAYIRGRIQNLNTKVPMLRSMLRAKKTIIDIGKEIDSARVIVIQSTEQALGLGVEFFNRLFLAMIANAAQARANRKAEDKLPAFLYVDEADLSIARDEYTVKVMTQKTRSQNLAPMFAFQKLQDFKESVKGNLLDCGIRIANAGQEAPHLAQNMEADVAFLKSMQRGEFALYMRDHTKKAIKLTIPDRHVSLWPKMPDAEWDELRRYWAGQFAYAPAPESPPEAPAPEAIIDAEFTKNGGGDDTAPAAWKPDAT